MSHPNSQHSNVRGRRTAGVASSAIILLVALSGCRDAQLPTQSPDAVPLARPSVTTPSLASAILPAAGDRIMIDTRESLQRATTMREALAAFGISADSRAGFGFAADMDGAGTNALRLDWASNAGSCSGTSPSIGVALPAPAPRALYVSFKQRLGRTATGGGLGTVGAFDVFRPECGKHGRFIAMLNRSGTSSRRIELKWGIADPGTPYVNVKDAAQLLTGTGGFVPQQHVGEVIDQTLYVKQESAAGASDGVIRLWMNGQLVMDRQGVAIGAEAFAKLVFPWTSPAPLASQSEYLWDVVAWEPSSTTTPPPSPAAVASVTVRPPSASVAPGATVQLTAEPRDADGNIITGRAVTWVSGNGAVATVSSTGLVTGVSAGSATITATVDGMSGTAAITVTSTAPAPVATVVVRPASASIAAGATIQLAAEARDASGNVLTGRSATWTSSNPGVAGVSASGLVTGVSGGSATISATIEGKAGTSAITVTAAPPPPPPGTHVLVGAGDIANCSTTSDEATARLLDGIAGQVFTAGDNVYTNGTPAEFTNCYEPTWGRHKSRTRPAPGNHDYNTSGASGYFAYFGASAGDPAKGYYAYDLGAWRIVVLNSNISTSTSSAQYAWLQADLTGNPRQCTLAIWHHPVFSSGDHGNSSIMTSMWELLYRNNAEVVVQGHDHNYERFAPMQSTGVRDDARGLRSFIVGTGGTSLRSFGTVKPNSELRNSTAHGVIKFELSEAGYRWSFIATSGAVLDSGTGGCH